MLCITFHVLICSLISICTFARFTGMENKFLAPSLTIYIRKHRHHYFIQRHSTLRSSDTDRLYQVAQSGRLKSWIDKLRSHASSCLNLRLSEESKIHLKTVSLELEDMRNYVNDLSVR
jgi:hypothetical protein